MFLGINFLIPLSNLSILLNLSQKWFPGKVKNLIVLFSNFSSTQLLPLIFVIYFPQVNYAVTFYRRHPRIHLKKMAVQPPPPFTKFVLLIYFVAYFPLVNLRPSFAAKVCR